VERANGSTGFGMKRKAEKKAIKTELSSLLYDLLG
jgi:hypothetical protein